MFETRKDWIFKGNRRHRIERADEEEKYIVCGEERRRETRGSRKKSWEAPFVVQRETEEDEAAVQLRGEHFHEFLPEFSFLS